MPLIIGTPITISAFGFTTLEEEIQFRGGTATVTVDGRYGDTVFVLPNALVKVDGGGEFETDDDGEAEVNTPNTKLTGETEDLKVELTLKPEIAQKIKNTLKKYKEVGIDNTTISTFLDDFPAKLAHTEDKEAQQKLLDGLKRTEYALFFIKEGKEFGEVSAKSLGTVTKDAVVNVYDMLDTITGATGKISDFVNAKGANVGGRAKEIIQEKLSGVRQAALKQMGAAFQAGLMKHAPNAGVWGGGLFKFIEDKLVADTAKAGLGEAPLEKWIADYFIKEQKKNSTKQMNQIASLINSGNFASLEYSADLDIAKNNYVNMADNYLQAEEGEYFSTMSKAYVDLGFDVVGKGVSILTPYGKFVDGLEKAYKVGRTAFLDAPTMYNWYATNGDIVNTTQKNINRALGISWSETSYQPTLTDILIPIVQAASEYQLSEYLFANVDIEFYESWAVATKALAELFPKEKKELKAYAVSLKEKATPLKTTVDSLSAEVMELIPVEEKEDWAVVKSEELSTGEDDNVDENEETGGLSWVWGILGAVLVLVIGKRFVKKR